MAKLDFPPLSTPEEFQFALETARKLISEDTITWRIAASGVSPRIDQQRLETVIPDESTRHLFAAILVHEIAPAVTEALFPHILTSYHYTLMSTDPDPKALQQVSERKRIVREKIVTATMRDRATIRSTSKGMTFDSLLWHISQKRHDLAEGKIASIPYATIEVVFGGNEAPGFLWTTTRRSVVFDCHLDDVKVLIQDLETLRNNLSQLGREREDPADG